MSGEVISVLSLEGQYYNCHDNYDIVTTVIQLISPSQSCDNLFSCLLHSCAFIRLQIGKKAFRTRFSLGYF